MTEAHQGSEESVAATMAGQRKQPPSAWRVVVPYCIFAAAWILFSDRFVATIAPDVNAFARVGIIKGLAFVAVSGLLLYLLLQAEHAAIRKAVHQRDDLLASEQAARAHAESANRAKDELFAIVSHELRTPLTSILAMTEVLRQDPSLSSEAAENLQHIHENILLECRIVNDLLDSTRLAAGKLGFSLALLDLNAVLGLAVRDTAPAAADHKITLAYAPAATPTMVMGDAGRLSQVFRNLLHNAIKFTPADGRITVRISTFQAPVASALVEVQDTGIGIAADVLPRLFAPFEQADRSTTRRFGGLGLGLYLARNLIVLHHGELDARSEGHSKGATFRVRLPLCQSVSAPTSAPARSAPFSPGSPLRLLVLLVDDNTDTLRALGRVLKTMGCDVVAAVSAETALAAASDRRFDVMLSDIGLPGRSGWDLMRDLRLQQNIPGIAISGFGSEEDIQRSREAGFRSHLVKPISFADLRNALDEVRAERDGATK